MCTTLQEFSDKLDRLDDEFRKKMEDQNKKFFADKPEESSLSPEMKEHYDRFEKLIQEHTEKFNKKMRDHSADFKNKFSDLLEQQKNAQLPGKQ
ncbi:kinetoplastid membrane protein KMP-11 [Perkinsela sp. CCAP 1560/4]|nr:kinetoplastid membrane protein KMP-11 [Perkinsela sp. CCAP 1560/4]|eukprot:KNH08249.1 kinetoplastid membrane protein KMP-11 [Perkinsela sp. CCAP 1560/4]